MNPMKYLIATGLTTAGGSIVAFLIYRARASVDLKTKEDSARIDMYSRRDDLELKAQAVPVQMLKEELAISRAELAEVRAQDREERKQHSDDMTAIRRAIEEIATDIRGQREEGRAHAARVHQRIDILDDRLLVIETNLDIKKRTA